MSILNNILSWIGDLFRAIPKELREKAEIALKVTTAIKNTLESDIADFVVAIIPGELDNEVKDTIVSALDFIAHWLGAVHVEEIPGIVHAMHPHQRNALLSMMASDITAHLDGKELKDSQYRVAVEAVYSKNKAG